MQPCVDQEFYVSQSVGDDALGVVLMQKDPKTGLMRPVYFASRVLTSLEQGFTQVEKVVLFLMFSGGKFCSYLLPKPFTMITIEDKLSIALRHMDSSARIAK